MCAPARTASLDSTAGPPSAGTCRWADSSAICRQLASSSSSSSSYCYLSYLTYHLHEFSPLLSLHLFPPHLSSPLLSLLLPSHLITSHLASPLLTPPLFSSSLTWQPTGVVTACLNGGICASRDFCDCIQTDSVLHESYKGALRGYTGWTGKRSNMWDLCF